MSWSVPPNFPVGSLLTSTLMNKLSADLTDLDSRTRPATALVATNETVTSTSYGDMATVGPQVAVVTGTAAMVAIFASFGTNTTGDGAFASFTVSGATTLAASDSMAAGIGNGNGGGPGWGMTGLWLVALTAGSNTFTMKYRAVAGGIASIANRSIIVWPANNLS